MAYWLLKSEPETYSIDHLERDGVNMWEGCRNYTVRNFLRDFMTPGDEGFFYHSSCDPAGIVGVLEIRGDAYPDPTQFDPKSEYYDPKSNPQDPRWFVRDVAFKRKFKRIITLAEMRTIAGLETMETLRKGNRLSITRVSALEWQTVMAQPGI